MKKIFIFSFLVLLIFLSRCSNSPEPSKVNCSNPDSINPNGTSELSLLMRQMHSKAVEMKNLIEIGKKPGDEPVDFANIASATPTDSKTKKPSFSGFAQNYLSALEAVYKSEPENIKLKYNEMVNACLSCHGDHCPGPVPKIKKLMIKN